MKYEAFCAGFGQSFHRRFVTDNEGDLEDVINRLSYEEIGHMDGVRLVDLREALPTFEVTLMMTDGERFSSFRQEETRADAIKHAIDAITFEMGDGLRIATVDVARVRVDFTFKENGNHTATWKATE